MQCCYWCFSGKRLYYFSQFKIEYTYTQNEWSRATWVKLGTSLHNQIFISMQIILSWGQYILPIETIEPIKSYYCYCHKWEQTYCIINVKLFWQFVSNYAVDNHIKLWYKSSLYNLKNPLSVIDHRCLLKLKMVSVFYIYEKISDVFVSLI